MPIRHAIWRVGSTPTLLDEVSLGDEETLEQMIVSAPTILSDRWMLIGRQIRTAFDQVIDLLALNPDGQLIIIELKRNQTPRVVVAQALDYASWVQDLEPDDIAGIFNRYSGGDSLSDAFKDYFGTALDEEQLNGSHQIVIVASSLDASTERIVSYLNRANLAINVIFFQVFRDGENQYLSRAWLIDPVETEGKAISRRGGQKNAGNGEYYVSFGHGDVRDWADAVKFGFVCGGGGPWYNKTLFLLEPGDRIWVNVPKQGYVGVGQVAGSAVRASDFEVEVDGTKQPFLEVASATYHREHSDNEEDSEYFVPVDWTDTKSLSEAVSEIGFFGNQNTVCRPRTSKWNHTVEQLRRHFKTM